MAPGENARDKVGEDARDQMGEGSRDEREDPRSQWRHLPPRPSPEDLVETKAVEPSAVSAEPSDTPIVRREWGG